MCFPYRNFLSASIPVHRRDVHIKKFVPPADLVYFPLIFYVDFSLRDTKSA